MENKFSVGDRVMFCVPDDSGYTAKNGWLGVITKIHDHNSWKDVFVVWDLLPRRELGYDEPELVLAQPLTEEDVL